MKTWQARLSFGVSLGAAAMLAAPLHAEEAPLAGGEVELYAEMLAMSRVCAEVADFRVGREELEGWMIDRLASAAPGDLDRVADLRDAKLTQLVANAQAVREMERGNSRRRAVDQHYAGLSGRCRALAGHRLAQTWFHYNGVIPHPR